MEVESVEGGKMINEEEGIRKRKGGKRYIWQLRSYILQFFLHLPALFLFLLRDLIGAFRLMTLAPLSEFIECKSGNVMTPFFLYLLQAGFE